MLTYDQLMQILMENDNAFVHCCYYFIEDLTDSAFEDHLREQVAQGRTEREVLSEYMASWIPWEEYGDKLCARIKEMAEA